MSSDPFTHSNGVATVSSKALSAYHLKGADVLGFDSKKLGTIDDVAFSKSGQADV